MEEVKIEIIAAAQCSGWETVPFAAEYDIARE